MFVNNGVRLDLGDEKGEIESLKKNIKHLQKFTRTLKPYFCKDFKEVQKENDVLQKRLTDLQNEQ